jgi:hypothetical protein
MTIEEQEIFNILNRVFERPKPFFISRDVDDILTIKDDFAIEFAEWIEKYQGGTPNSKILKQLLEKFKKEKNL